MTKDEFNDLYNRLGLADKELSQRLDVNQSTVWRWRHGIHEVPSMVRVIMEMMIKEKDCD